GKIEIATSAFTLAEVYYKESKIIESAIETLSKFLTRDYCKTVPVDMEVASQAQRLQMYVKQKMKGKIIKPPDAIHIASAQRAKVDVLHSYDKRVLSFNEKLLPPNNEKMKICKPGQELELFAPLIK
ncbi:MAG: PIN domain-containing protein, partial [Alphaproteobacteria bacterium]|nr:PIN domain-containing protein [Alphaproteobacteria bacterium]